MYNIITIVHVFQFQYLIIILILQENLIYFQEELKDTKQILSNILGSAPQPGGPPTAPQHAEPELVIVPSTKPSAPPTSSSVITVAPPTSPLKLVLIIYC